MLAPFVGAIAAELGAFAGSTWLCVAARSRRTQSAGRPLARRASWPIAAGALGRLVAGVLAGFSLFPVLACCVGWLGLTLGLPAARTEAAAGLSLIGSLILAPAFEEILYREQLLEAQRARFGAGPALLCSSALFALPHASAWPVLGTFAAGLVLGGLRLATGRLSEGIGAHAGLNLGCIALESSACGGVDGALIAPGLLLGGALITALSLGNRARRARPV